MSIKVAAQFGIVLGKVDGTSGMEFLAGDNIWDVTNSYFMNLPAGKYEAYPEGQSDNTHFQTEGARFVASLVFDALKSIRPVK